MAVASSNRHYFTEGPHSRNLGKVSTLHREEELKIVSYDGSESDSDEEESSMDSVKELPYQVCRREKPLHTTGHTSAFRSLSSAPLSPPSSHHPRISSQPSSPQPSLRFQQNMLAAKLAKKTPPPNFMDVPWYHPSMTRHVAESILLSKNIPDGTYLLRNSSNSDTVLTMSVSYKTSVKHYRVVWDGKELCFGLGKFKNIAEFKEHFESQPIISGESGLLVYLKHPYPRNVKEFIDYEEPLFSEGLEILENKPSSPNAPSFTINSKDGFLTKLGQHRKNWKLRWFVLYKNQLSYYPTKETRSSLRDIKITDITSVQKDTSMGKDFCFSLVTSYRTFYMFARTQTEADDWIRVLKWKVDQNTQEITI